MMDLQKFLKLFFMAIFNFASAREVIDDHENAYFSKDYMIMKILLQVCHFYHFVIILKNHDKN